MTTIKIMTDSSCDLPGEIVGDIGVSVVPLSVQFGEECMKPDMALADFYARMKEESSLPTTASPSPQHFLHEFQKEGADRDLLVICLSAQLSSTYHHAVMAREMLLEEGYAGRIEVIDSMTTSLGLGVLVYQAAQQAAAGLPFEQVVRGVHAAIAKSDTFFFLDTLENVIKGGRLDRVRGTVASVLNIKLLMKKSDEGTIEVVEKIRGTQQALKKLMTYLDAKVHDYDKDVIAIAHSNCEARGRDFMQALLQKHPFRNVLFANMGTVIGTYAGEGGVLVAY
ncbi:DegV family protein [Paenibacillus whitsoniae]|uniref:DegV family protein n=1 Tax=Paenibacillus whitsoniae TaxID=2496558 RepID=A0A3S0I818_9BACL|nr:DegV family protein [Paenibacillus whitsoniae]RTE05812.1 DegV family protein [Paenibacillus whitsoniae]